MYVVHRVDNPLVAPEEYRSANRYPRHARRDARKEGPDALVSHHAPEHLAHRHALLGQHDPRLEHVERRRRRGGHASRQAAVDGALPGRDVPPVVATPAAPSLHGLPQRELDDGEGHLAEDGDAPAAVQLAPHGEEPPSRGRVPAEDVAQGLCGGAAVVAGLGALLDDLGGHAHGAGGDFAEAGGSHVREDISRYPTSVISCVVAISSYSLAEEALCGFVGAEEEGRAGSRSDDGGADAAVDA